MFSLIISSGYINGAAGAVGKIADDNIFAFGLGQGNFSGIDRGRNAGGTALVIDYRGQLAEIRLGDRGINGCRIAAGTKGQGDDAVCRKVINGGLGSGRCGYSGLGGRIGDLGGNFIGGCPCAYGYGGLVLPLEPVMVRFWAPMVLAVGGVALAATEEPVP